MKDFILELSHSEGLLVVLKILAMFVILIPIWITHQIGKAIVFSNPVEIQIHRFKKLRQLVKETQKINTDLLNEHEVLKNAVAKKRIAAAVKKDV